MTESLGRRLFELTEPVSLVTYVAAEPAEAVMALGLPSVWDRPRRSAFDLASISPLLEPGSSGRPKR